MTTNIQLYQQVKDNIGTTITVAEVIATIAGKTTASTNIEQRIIKLRLLKKELAKLKTKGTAEQIKEKESQVDDCKQGLPAVTWGGTFAPATIISGVKTVNEFKQGLITWADIHQQKKYKVRTRAIEQHEADSGLMVLDIDGITDDNKFKALWLNLVEDQHTFLLFRSPSGNGIKPVVKIPNEGIDRKAAFLQIEKYYLNAYGIELDASGKDVSRLCFLTVDTVFFFHNASAVPFDITKELTEPEIKKLSSITANEKKTLQANGQQCNDIFDSTQQYFSYTEGNRNNFIFKFACNCNRVGISETESLQFALNFAGDVSPQQVTTTVQSAYKSNANEHGKFKKQKNAGSSNKVPAENTGRGNLSQSKRPVSSNDTNGKTVEPDFIFWKEQKFKKGKGESAYEVTNYNLSRVDFCDFLFAKGFHLLPTGDEEGFQIVHSGNGIMKPIAPREVKHFSLDWCKRHFLKEVEEMLRKGQTKYFAKNELDSLPYKEVPVKRDTLNETFFYFSNGYIVVDNSGGITQKDYSTLDGFIWESNKIKFDYKDVQLELINDKDELLPYNMINCEFAKFIAYASYNPNNDEEKHFSRRQVTDRFLSFCSAIGFLLDGYKHPSKRTAIFSIDHKIGERNEANGRTGKSMIPQACERLKRVANISGKNYDPKYQFCDEPITVDTQIINFNDMQRNFDVENIFEKIADPYSVNRRNQGFIHFKYINSPKIYYSTNFIPKGDGESYKSRMSVIEFSDYFNSQHTPYDEFGHGFFDDSWPVEEWQRFYCFMVWCVAYYKENGLTDYPLPNIEARKLVNDVVPEFIDFMEDPDKVEKNSRLVKIEVMEKYNETHLRFYNKKITPHQFTSWIKKFCTTKGYKLNPKQNGKYDKSNSVEYITIADNHFNNEQTKLL